MPDSRRARVTPDRIFLAGAIALGAVITLCAAGASSFIASIRWVDHTLEVRQALQERTATILDANTGVHSFVASGLPAFLEPYDAALGREKSDASRLRALVEDNPAQAAQLDAADRDADVVLADLGELVRLVRNEHRDDALQRLEGESRDRVDQFRDDMRAIRLEEERSLAAVRSEARARGVELLAGALVLTLLSCVLLAVAWKRERTHQDVLAGAASIAQGRLTSLSELATALSNARTRAEVASVVIEHGMRSARADTFVLYEMNTAGTALELVGDCGIAPEVLDTLRTITASSGNPGTYDAVKAGESKWAESLAEYASLYPALRAIKSDRPRAEAFWSIPLLVEGLTLGLLGAGFYRPRSFPPDERAFVETLAKHCAEALLRVARLEREDEAEQWLATTLRSIGDAVVATDEKGRVTFMNRVAESLTGWTERDARGQPLETVFCIFSEETGDPAENPVAKVIREGVIVGLANHTVLRSKDGKDIPVDDSGAPIRNESGRMIGVVLVFRDMTHEKRERVRSEFLAKAGEALVESLDYSVTLSTIASFAVPTLADWCAIELLESGTSRQVAVAHVDPEKVRFARALGERYPPDRNASTGVPNVLRTGKSELYTEIPRDLLEASARDEEHLRMIRDLRLSSAMIVALRAKGRTFGAITFVYADSGRRYEQDDLHFAEDFARRAALAIEKARALKDAEEARRRESALRTEAELVSHTKDEFLATVSHELRTPLNAILGWAVMLRRREWPADVERSLAVIERNARAQSKLIEDVLDISRITSGKLALNLGATSVAEAVRAAVESVTPAAEAKGIRLSTEFPDASLIITADPDRLQQIAWNLLSNAVKFTPKGGHIDVSARREGSDVSVIVRDTGEGIRKDVLPLVFERFQQADASITRRHGGLGLGLAIVKQLVLAHGGTVGAESEGEGKGSTFTVRLPARSAVPALKSKTRTTTVDISADNEAERPSLEGLRLLVVDDEQDALGLVGEVLRSHGAEVHVAGSVREALAKFESLRPHLVVSDIGMPELDGFALIRKIRALPAELGGKTPAVALTAYVRAEDAQRAFLAGFQMHVAKPVEPAQLVAVVARLALS